ncbi:MAG: hypothetical protein IT529_10510 [Burkholderiales bacterium]|nr:hypothetical protein [Burkholderiales bacterium]
MKYFLVALVLAVIAAAEYFHVLAGDHAMDAAVCSSPGDRAAVVRDMLLGHLNTH